MFVQAYLFVLSFFFCFVNLGVNNTICQMLEMMLGHGMLLIGTLANVEDTQLLTQGKHD